MGRTKTMIALAAAAALFAAGLARLGIGARDSASKAPAAPQAAPPAAPDPSLAEIRWIRIPAGAFTMGSPGRTNEQPHRVSISAFEMSRTLVTNRQYRSCVAAKACPPAQDFGKEFDGDDQPVVGVDWKMARAFAKWAGGRLPSESEWEYAARSAGKDYTYPWGNDAATCDRAAISGCASEAPPVCSKPKGDTEQGLCDMAGSVWEWTEDWYHESYKGAPTDGRPRIDRGSYRVFRGGAWSHNAGDARASNRFFDIPESRGDDLGFRIAR
jgi:formylglycine-generating enzyme required for sulfatase activity